MKELVYDEILLGIPGNRNDLEAFATKILERFYNPYIRHEWKSIALNAMSKWETRNLPSLLDYYEKEGRLPQKMVFSLAATIAYYKGSVDGISYTLNDDQWILDFYREVWRAYDGTPEGMYQLTSKVLNLKQLWKQDLSQVSGLTEALAGYLYLIEQTGMKQAVKSVLSKRDPEKKVA